jgi:hypothetical protein
MGIFARMRKKRQRRSSVRDAPPESYVNERLDHLGRGAGVCEEIRLREMANPFFFFS